MSQRWRESWRVLAYSVALALGFVGLQRLELALLSAFGTPAVLERIGAGPGREEAALAVEAEQLAARSTSASSLPAGHRLTTFRLGYEIGFASELVGSFAMSEAAARAQAATIGAAHVAAAQAHARALGLGDVGALPMRTPRDFFALAERIEADENGLGARIEARLTPIHRHLYLPARTSARSPRKSRAAAANSPSLRLPRSVATRRLPALPARRGDRSSPTIAARARSACSKDIAPRSPACWRSSRRTLRGVEGGDADHWLRRVSQQADGRDAVRRFCQGSHAGGRP